MLNPESAVTPIGVHQVGITNSKETQRKKRRRGSGSPRSVDSALDRRSAVVLEVQKHLLVGFNQVTRHLEKLSATSGKKHGFSAKATDGSSDAKLRHIAAVFLLRPLDDLIYSHLPTLCHTATAAHPELPATRLVPLDPGVEKQVAAALGHSTRVSVLAILSGCEEVPGAKPLIDYVQAHLEPIEVPCLKEALEGKWLGTNINTQ